VQGEITSVEQTGQQCAIKGACGDGETYPGISPRADRGAGGVSADAESGSRNGFLLWVLGSSIAIGLLRVGVAVSWSSVTVVDTSERGKPQVNKYCVLRDV